MFLTKPLRTSTYTFQKKKKLQRTGCGIWEHSNFDKNAPPKDVKPENGMSAWTAMVFPGTLLSSGPDWVQIHNKAMEPWTC